MQQQGEVTPPTAPPAARSPPQQQQQGEVTPPTVPPAVRSPPPQQQQMPTGMALPVWQMVHRSPQPKRRGLDTTEAEPRQNRVPAEKAPQEQWPESSMAYLKATKAEEADAWCQYLQEDEEEVASEQYKQLCQHTKTKAYDPNATWLFSDESLEAKKTREIDARTRAAISDPSRLRPTASGSQSSNTLWLSAAEAAAAAAEQAPTKQETPPQEMIGRANPPLAQQFQRITHPSRNPHDHWKRLRADTPEKAEIEWEEKLKANRIDWEARRVRAQQDRKKDFVDRYATKLEEDATKLGLEKDFVERYAPDFWFTSVKEWEMTAPERFKKYKQQELQKGKSKGREDGKEKPIWLGGKKGKGKGEEEHKQEDEHHWNTSWNWLYPNTSWNPSDIKQEDVSETASASTASANQRSRRWNSAMDLCADGPPSPIPDM